MTEQTVGALMRKHGLTLTPDTPMRDAVTKLIEADASAAPVLDEQGALIGVISQKDCFAAALHSAYYQSWSGTVRQHMTTEVTTLNADTDLVTAAEMFRTMPYRAFPVLQNGQFHGMIDRADLLRAFLAFG
ncbi:CBS domain-containing protein [Primorskyibacter sedentarius]|uniref:CBS domain-containing protein n=1 Tax=Primorskyibacter sedentarius TaxID=745311 RepID=A0A4R3JLK8_9RHOB|nr:CBS domain-containing protein [Primorskyibacter sedentarius]TCS66470.1 CBS domain-containing protein [Primorskyibacter sedentarius]